MSIYSTVTPVLFLFLLLGQQAVAQPEAGRDELLGGVMVGMTRADVEAHARQQGWVRRKRTPATLVYVVPASDDGSARYTFTFRDGIIAAADGTISLDSPKLGKRRGAEIAEAGRQALMARAERVTSKGKKTICTHTASDGSTIRTTWTSTAQAAMRIEMIVIQAGE